MSIGIVTETGLRGLLTDIFNGINKRINDRIVKTIDSSSDINHVPSAKTVYDATKSFITIERVVGDINTVVTEPKSNVIYIQKNADADTSYTQYIYNGTAFEVIGRTDAVVNEMTDEQIKEIVDEVYSSTSPNFSSES